ncbi:hypothetical protein NPIL_198521 [Nephila pilipes]|uniref:Uncharacterized protein n=1 Tax=Nephila pilipes TaxID=299642 RepID=A0A8X6Q1Z9_NEPPI|nr:hypothetical protein NPIL_198521 [Nephila pilipes]
MHQNAYWGETFLLKSAKNKEDAEDVSKIIPSLQNPSTVHRSARLLRIELQTSQSRPVTEKETKNYPRLLRHFNPVSPINSFHGDEWGPLPACNSTRPHHAPDYEVACNRATQRRA